jgi:hypothetical protein
VPDLALAFWLMFIDTTNSSIGMGSMPIRTLPLEADIPIEMREVMKNILEEIPVPPWQELTHSTIIADPSEQGSGIPEALQEKGLHVVFEDIGSGCSMVVFGFFRHLARRVPYEEVMTANETRNLKALLPPIPALGVHRLSLFLGS